MCRNAVLLCAVFLLGTTGCVQLGPKMVVPAGFSYNEAMADTWNQQLLLNLVRMHHHEPPFFLEPSSVVTGYTFSGDLRSTANFGRNGGLDDTLGLNSGASYSERPTITYQPLTGEAFTKKMLTPIAPETLILLARSGWSVKTIILALVQEVNGLSNPHSRATVQGSAPPIQRVSDLLQNMQQTGELVLEVAAESGSASRLILQGVDTSQAREVRSLLALPAGANEFQITRLRVRDPNEISIIGRSLLDTLQYLSQAVESDEAVQSFPKELFQVRSRLTRPRDVFVSVKHRGRWFYISHDDKNSKALMGLLTQLFSLQATGGSGRSPLLTIPQ